jgi:Leucine-rich repeat (LRR) protein
MQCVNSDSGPRTGTIKDVVINVHTEEIDLPHSEVTDEDIEGIKSFRGIKTLILGENNISNFGFFTICNSFQDLRKLFINHNQISDDGVTTIVKLKNLKCLDIRCNKITS